MHGYIGAAWQGDSTPRPSPRHCEARDSDGAERGGQHGVGVRVHAGQRPAQVQQRAQRQRPLQAGRPLGTTSDSAWQRM